MDLRQFVQQSILNAISIPIDPDVPPITLLVKPVFSTGDTVTLFWDGLPNPLELPWKDVPLSDCLIELQAALDTNFTEIERVAPSPTATEVSAFHVVPPSWIGQKIYYRAILYVPKGSSGVSGDPAKAVIVSTIPDITAPTLEFWQWTDRRGNPAEAKNGWFRTDSLQFSYSGLADPAGIYTATFKYDGTTLVRTFIDVPDGNPGPFDVAGNVDVSKLTDGIYTVNFSARDAGYLHTSHGLGVDLAPFWQIDGVEADGLVIDTLKIDRQPPQIDMNSVRSLYASPDTVDYGTIEMTVLITDRLSGVDEESIKVSFSPAVNYEFRTEKSQDTCSVIITVSDLGEKDTVSTVTVDASDIAGNPAATATKAIEFLCKAPQLTSFRLADLDAATQECLAPHPDFSNSTTVLIDDCEHDPHPRDPVSLQICGDSACVVVPWPDNGGLKFDVRRVTGAITSGKEIILSLKAIDALGNMSKNGLADTIKYDIEIEDIRVTVRDTSAWEGDAPGRYGAYALWTNDRDVLVDMTTLNSDIYKISQSEPAVDCRDGAPLSFLVHLPDGDSLYSFAYQAGDSAGNRSNRAFGSITLDTSIFVLDESHIRLYDPISQSEEFATGVTVQISFQKEKLPADHNISRMVVDSSLYYVGVDSILTLPTGDGIFEISVIDLAGNESRTITKSIQVVPNFSFALSDTSKKSPAQAGWTNDSVVAWDTVSTNFKSEQLAEIIFYMGDEKDSIVWRKGEPKQIALGDFYHLVSGNRYGVQGRVRLIDGSQTPKEFMSSDSIRYDDKNPMIVSLSLSDQDSAQRAAETGYTNGLDVALFMDVSDDQSGVDSLMIEGDGSVLTDQGMRALPTVISFSDRSQVTLTRLADLFQADIACTVRDRAGNWMATTSKEVTSIIFLEQKITIGPDGQNYQVAEDELEDFEFDVSLDCDYKKYLSFAEIKLNDQSLDTVASSLFDYDADSLVCHIPYTLTDDGTYSISLIDRAGNESGVITANVKILRPPAISLSLYDFSEYNSDNPQDSDSLYTDALNEERTIKAVVKRDANGGEWSHVRFAFAGEEMKENWQIVPAASSALFDISIDTIDVECDIILFAQARNDVFESEIVADTIRHDIIAPELRSLAVQRVNNSDEWRVIYEAEDLGECRSGVAGIVVRDSVAATGMQKWFYTQQLGDDPVISLERDSGHHHLFAYVVDKADVNQTQPSFETTSEADLFAALGKVDHQSNIKSDDAWALQNIAYNFPNPFNPAQRSTTINLPLQDVSAVDIRIFDLFGNLVWESLRVSPNQAADNFFIEWNGRNGHGDLVASGTYLAIIKPDNDEALEPIKIGVLRKSTPEN
ncbi:hypothetical protein JXA02_01125 [candidate division KSB1 bacterium]|nr:hypothetical protein [candidate division KSB1 bacterium]RQW11053.1 MAG: hypothetical protein EH222_01200 [candidate division KSB1 bacterium]